LTDFALSGCQRIITPSVLLRNEAFVMPSFDALALIRLHIEGSIRNDFGRIQRRINPNTPAQPEGGLPIRYRPVYNQESPRLVNPLRIVFVDTSRQEKA
jgi:hypothetical protein